jgi:small nuclear ribonucleoprotein (snRNP)-like protein
MGYFMPSNNYQIIFSGQILNGYDENDVRKNLEELFSSEQIDYLFKNPPAQIKKDITLDHAKKIASKLELLGAKCEVSPIEDDDISLSIESDETSLALETPDHPEENVQDDPYENQSNESLSTPRMICPSCGFEQIESNDCINCGIIIDRYQDNPEGVDSGSEPKKDILQEYLEEMSKVPKSEPKTDVQGTSWFLKLVTALVLIILFSAFGWSYYFFVYKKPWRTSVSECVTINEIDDQMLENDLSRLQSKKETIEALQKALKRKNKLVSTNKYQQSDNQFKLKNIPIQLLRHYVGKYVWVTCDNDSVHQGTLDAIYKEQIILKKGRFNLTIPINISMIKTVECDMTEKQYEDDAVEAYQAYKKRTEETFQQVAISQLGSYHGKNLHIYLKNGHVYEGVLSQCKSDTITLQNIVYGQMVTFVIRKKSINNIYY